MRDVYTDALNSSAGRLAEIVLKKLAEAGSVDQLPDGLRERLDRLVSAPGRSGQLARIRLAVDVAYLFGRIPTWTKAKMLPLFDWSSPDAADAWQARKYANHFGSPELFHLTKEPFLAMFGRPGVPSDALRTFIDWLTLILVVNQARKAQVYLLSAPEARSAVRRVGAEALPSVANRLAAEMEAAKPEQKAEFWRDIIGPVFQAIWPLDVELQSHASTFKLVQMLKATGEAFPEAADVVIPFVRPDAEGSHSAMFSLTRAPDTIYTLSPSKVLDLAAAISGDISPSGAYALRMVLNKIRETDPKLANTRKFQKLLSHIPE